jgi:hypothetical protein
MTAGGARFRKMRVVVAIVLAEALPLLLLFAIVFAYGVMRQKDSLSPAEFAPLAGNWVGPIGGFLATLLFAWWAARSAQKQRLAHGAIVGVGTAVLDLGLGMLLGGAAAMRPIFFVSNAGRLLAGVLGGWLATRSSGRVS